MSSAWQRLLDLITHSLTEPHVLSPFYLDTYRQTSDKQCNLIGNKIVDHSDVAGASPVGAALITHSLST